MLSLSVVPLAFTNLTRVALSSERAGLVEADNHTRSAGRRVVHHQSADGEGDQVRHVAHATMVVEHAPSADRLWAGGLGKGKGGCDAMAPQVMGLEFGKRRRTDGLGFPWSSRAVSGNLSQTKNYCWPSLTILVGFSFGFLPIDGTPLSARDHSCRSLGARDRYLRLYQFLWPCVLAPCSCVPEVYF